MRICNCTLTNTKACLSCPQYLNDINTDVIVTQKIIPFKEVTEEYYKNGTLVKRVIKETKLNETI